MLKWTIEPDGSQVALCAGWELRITPFPAKRWKVEARATSGARAYWRRTAVGDEAAARHLAEQSVSWNLP